MRHRQRFNPTDPPAARALTRRSVPETARHVLLSATEIFVGRRKHDVEETRIFLELARNLLPGTPTGDRRSISNLLAGHSQIPDDLQEDLARDDDALTAAPALRKSPRLSVDLLIERAKEGPETVRQAIAERPSLRESVIDALCEHGEATVIETLLARDDITFSTTHQAKLSRRSEIIASLGLELAGRDALHPDGLMGQFLHLPASLKKQAIAAAEMTSLIKQAQTPGETMSKRSDTNRLQTQEALVKAALEQNRSAFATQLSQGLGLSRPTCNLLMENDQGEGLTIALKALGMPEFETTTVLIRMLGEDTQLNDLRGLLRMHRTLSNGAAEALVGQWQQHDLPSQRSAPRYSSQYQDASGRKLPLKTPLADRGTGTRKKVQFAKTSEG